MNRLKAAIVGANDKGKYIKEAIERSDTHRLVYFCDETEQTGNCFEKTEVLDFKSLAGKYNEKLIDMILIADMSHMYRQILNKFASLGIRDCHVVNQFFYVDPIHRELTKEFIAVDMSKPDLDYCEVHIADHCNLNCKGCTHYCNLITAPSFPSLESYQKDIAALRKLYWNVTNFRLMGGEPLLNSQLPEFIKAARLAFPAANIYVVTNGMLIENQTETLFKVMRDYRSGFQISAYPLIYNKREELIEFLARHGIVWAFVGETVPIKEFHKNGVLNENYKGDPKKSYRKKKCGKKFLCNFLRDGWLYPCGSFPFEAVFENYYGVKFNNLSEELRQSLRINIHETELNGWEINKIIDEPHEACRYCDPQKKDVYFPWEVRGKNDVPMEDWLI